MTSAAKQQTLSLPPVKEDTQVPFENLVSSTQSLPSTPTSNGFFDKLERKIHNFNKGY